MPRKAREKSPTGFYHIMMRGINKERIFKNNQHKEFLLEILKQGKEDIKGNIGAYCILDNHIHLVVKGDINEITQYIKRINIRFAMRYNKNLERVGHVFQDRYKSEIIYNENHLIQVIRYIHNNPVKAGITSDISAYRWTSYKEYFTKSNPMISSEVKALVLDVVGGIKAFKAFHTKDESVLFIDTEEEVEKAKKEVFDRVMGNYLEQNGITDVSQIKNNAKTIPNLVKILLEQGMFSHREIADLLNVNRNIVHLISNGG